MYAAISPRRPRTIEPSSPRSAYAPPAVSRAPATPRATVQVAASSRMPWPRSAAPRRASPASRIRPARTVRSTSATPLEVAGVEGEGDAAEHEIERDRLAPDQALDEVEVVQVEREVGEETAQGRGRRLEVLEMPHEPQREEDGGAQHRGDDLVLGQRRAELSDGEARHPEKDEADVAGEDGHGLGLADEVERDQIHEGAGD